MSNDLERNILKKGEEMRKVKKLIGNEDIQKKKIYKNVMEERLNKIVRENNKIEDQKE